MRSLFSQLEPMRTLAAQLKHDQQVSAMDKVTSLEAEMDKVVTKIQVRLRGAVMSAFTECVPHNERSCISDLD